MKKLVLVLVLVFIGCGGDDPKPKNKYDDIVVDYDKEIKNCKGDACDKVATIYYLKTDNAKYKKEIVALYDKGCETKSYSSCFTLANFYDKGGVVVNKDPAKYKSYLDKSWDLASMGQKVSIALLYPSYDR